MPTKKQPPPGHRKAMSLLRKLAAVPKDELDKPKPKKKAKKK